MTLSSIRNNADEFLAKSIWKPIISGLLTGIIWTLIQVLTKAPEATTISVIFNKMGDKLVLSLVVGFATFISMSWKLLHEWKSDFMAAYYSGFFRLGDHCTSNKLKDLEVNVIDVTKKKSKLRSVILEYIICSMEAMGQNGFAIADSGVDAYVGFISELANKSDRVAMTCVVRPYWFVVDAIQGCTLAPFRNGKDAYGKGEHLRCFSKRENNPPDYQRCLIVDEIMLAEILLSAHVDLRGFKMDHEQCPCCQGNKINNNCAFHGKRTEIDPENTDNLPEISWFSKEVNENRGIKLIYTRIDGDSRASLGEFEDRVFATSSELSIDLRFSFTNLEQGTMRLKWGDNARKLATIEKFNLRVNPEDGKEDRAKGHKFYDKFFLCLNNGMKKKVIEHLEVLKNAVEQHFTTEKVACLSSAEADTLRRHLCNGDGSMKKFIIDSINELIKNLTHSEDIKSFYKNLVDQYLSIGSSPLITYIITLDSANPQFPIRTAQRDRNWNGILNGIN